MLHFGKGEGIKSTMVADFEEHPKQSRAAGQKHTTKTGRTNDIKDKETRPDKTKEDQNERSLPACMPRETPESRPAARERIIPSDSYHQER